MRFWRQAGNVAFDVLAPYPRGTGQGIDGYDQAAFDEAPDAASGAKA
jgi:hypothetical protein